MIRRRILPILIATLLLSAVFTLAYYSTNKTDSICHTLSAIAEDCKSSCISGAYTEAGKDLSAFKEIWDTHRLFFAATQSHDDIDEINTALRASSIQIANECIDEMYAELAVIADTLEKMREIQHCSLENIL